MDNNEHCLLKGNCELMVKLSCLHGQAMKHWYPLNKLLMQKFHSFPSITPTTCALSKNWYSRFRVLVSIAHCTVNSITRLQAWNCRVLCGIWDSCETPPFQNQFHCNCVSDGSAQCTVETRNPVMTAPTNNHLPIPKAQMLILHRQEPSTFNPEHSPRHSPYHLAS